MIFLKDTAIDSARELRHAFGCFATGVAVVTCKGSADEPIAVTVNSFTSVSLSPSLVSFSLTRAAHCLPAFLADSRFAVHVLHAHQLAVSSTFAHPTTASWNCIPHKSTSSGHIMLEEFVAAFLCERWDWREIGDHVVIVGQVGQFAYDAAAKPLAFCNGRYGSLMLAGPRLTPFDQDECSAAMAQLSWG